MKKTILTFGVALTLTLLSGCQFSAHVSPAQPDTTAISGNAWMNRLNGQSDLLRGLNVSLCKATSDYLFQQTAKPEPLLGRNHDFEVLTIALDRMDKMSQIKGTCPYRTATDINAKYQFAAVPPGVYQLYASFRSPNSLAYWSIPITVGLNR